MDIICIDSDIHFYGAPWTGLDPRKTPTRPTRDPLGRIWDVSLWVNLGDVIEINNCLKDNLSDAIQAKQEYMQLVDVNVPGNHGLDIFKPNYVTRNIQELNIRFSHGHLGALWDYEKGYKYITKNKPGCGKLKYFFCKLLHFGRSLYKWKMTDKIRKRIIDSHGGEDVLIFGHAHCKTMVDDLIFVNGKFCRIFVLEQGRSYFKVFNDEIEFLGKD